MLCKLAREIMAPERDRGSSRATGVMVPVRLTDHSTSRSAVTPLSPWNL